MVSAAPAQVKRIMLRRRRGLHQAGVLQPPILDRPRPYVMAHRGDSDHAPENTFLAFELALAAGADAIETDLWLSADGVLVCHHDELAARMTGDPRRIGEMRLDELRRLKVRGARFPDASDQEIPSLADLLDWMPEDRLLVLEIKDLRLTEPAQAEGLAAMLERRVRRRSVVCIAFDLAPLVALKTASPELAVGHIAMRNPLPTQFTDLIGVNYKLLQLNPLYVAMAHLRGRWVAPLDPDLNRRLERYLRLGVDAVLTNDPGDTRRRIEAYRARR